MADVEDRVEPGMETESPPAWRRLLAGLLRWETLLIVLLLASIAYGASVSPHFLDSTTMFFIGLNVGEIAIIALPLTLIIITGRSTSPWPRCSASRGSSWPSSSSTAGRSGRMIAAVLLGGVLGAFNGFLITRIGLPSLAVTIGTLTLYRGIAQGSCRRTRSADSRRASRTSASSRSAHAHLVFGRHLPGARGRLRNHPPRDAAGARDLRHRRKPGGGLLLRYPRQADQVLALRPLGDDVRPSPVCSGRSAASARYDSGIGSSCSW